MSAAPTNLTAKEQLAYEDRWSRLAASLGLEALKRFQTARVLVSGLKGLGLEIAKNVVLMGARAVTIHDPRKATLSDLSSNFYLGEDQVGQNIADAIRPKLAELNPRVDLVVHNGDLIESIISHYTVVVLTDAASTAEIKRIGEFCHSKNIAFVATETFGLYGYIFADFGSGFKVYDKTGEPAKNGFIELIDKNGLVSLLENKRHDLEDGDFVSFSDVKGMTELNNADLTFKVTVKSPTVFSIGDVSAFKGYEGGGQFTEVRKPAIVNHDNWSQLNTAPPSMEKIQLADYSKFEHPPQYWLAMHALYQFKEAQKRLPAPNKIEEADQVVQLAVKFNDTLGTNKVEKVNEALIKRIARQSSGNLSPMAAFFGGIVAQEAIKAASGKYTPLNQWFMFDSLECLPDQDLPMEEYAPSGTRYDGQIAVFGHKMQHTIQAAKYFLVGAGAIGCEMLKNWAMMGIGAGHHGGTVTVTDMDNIEVSNLNRQFLYREWDVKKMKSETAAAAAKKMNPHMNLKALTIKVAKETEDVYTDDFWMDLTGVCNALDNVAARLYVDTKCLFYGKSLLESGTLGPKGNTQVVIPHQTESYGSSTDPPEKNPPVCLVHSFPHNIEHCLQWAREIIFEGRFVADADVVNKFLTKADYVATLAPNMKRTVLETIREILVSGQKSLDECVLWARKLFEKVFVSDIQQLIWQFPPDFKDPKTGSPFWTGAKRPPTPDFFDPNNELHINFIVAATFLRAWNLNIVSTELKPADIEQVRKHIVSVAAAAKVEPWKPKGPIKIAVEESETAQPAADFGEDDDVVCAAILKELPTFHAPAHTSPKLCNVVDFEKDNDENFHIDLIHAAANIRANQYKIKIVERLQSKLIAGKIIPAIVTTTSSVTGLVCLELYKLLQQPARKIDHFRNTFVNLALPLVQQSEPIPPKKVKFNGKDHSIWDRIDIKEGDLTLQQVLDWIKKNLQVDVDILGVGQSLIFSTFMPAAKRTERLAQKLTTTIEEITKTPLKSGQRHVGIEVTGTINGEDVDVPQLTLWY